MDCAVPEIDDLCQGGQMKRILSLSLFVLLIAALWWVAGLVEDVKLVMKPPK